MAKQKKLTKGQVRRIKANQDKKLRNIKESVQWLDDDLGEPIAGTIISRLPQFKRSSLSSNVTLLKGITPYVQYGNLIILSLLLSLVIGYSGYYVLQKNK